MNGYFDLNQQTYDWCVRLFDRAKKLLGVRIKLHHEQGQLERGDIFLFNHFARAETFIPQYMIYNETGAFCRSIASGEFFKGNDRFTKLLRDVGAVPNDHPELLPMLAVDILKGRKIIIFPEGGMVKDRQVLDDDGEYGVFSRHANTRRKHHSGAARLALGLQIFKRAVAHRLARGKRREIEQWAEELGLPTAEMLISNIKRPVTVVPANITFYPLRIGDNFLRRGADFIVKGLSPRAIEELIVEGNLFFKTTDMDIRLGEPIQPAATWEWWEKTLVGYLSRDLPNLPAVFSRDYLEKTLIRRIATKGLHASIDGLRNRYMRDIYRKVTVNMSHLASCVVLAKAERQVSVLPRVELGRTIYLALKKLQVHQHVHLHRSLCNPAIYRHLLASDPPALAEFLESAVAAELLRFDGDNLVLLDKLLKDHAFDLVRLENPLEVYANEVEPIAEVGTSVQAALAELPQLTHRDLAALRFDDELKSLEWDRVAHTKAEHREINSRETANADPSPFLLQPPTPQKLGVLLVHGFLASPAEVRDIGDKLANLGYPVLGVRLKGHGTSPWDLRERSWRDWLGSVRDGFEILSAYAERICIVGFSTGGALGLAFAASTPRTLAGVVAISTPIKFRNRNMRFVPLMHGANQLVEWVSNYEGVVPFRPNESEHPHINYRNMPIRGLYELTRMVAQVKKNLPQVKCPVCVIQGTQDRVVDPVSATLVYDRVGTDDKQLHWIESTRHGILNENIGDTHARVLDFLDRVSRM